MRGSSLLITGVSSGLGKNLYSQWGGLGLTRQNQKEVLQKASQGIDTIVHCAVRRDFEDLALYYEDNLSFVNDLLTLPHKRFVFLSSIDVYPKDQGGVFREDVDFDFNQYFHPYSLTKLFGESLVQKKGKSPLVLRASMMLGAEMRPNNLTRLCFENDPKLSLSESSTFNLISYDAIAQFIESCIEKEVSGVFNLAAWDSLTLGQIANLLQKKPSFGDHTYLSGEISIEKALLLDSRLKRSSQEYFLQFLEQSSSKPIS